ncbi:MAG: hypothetical protein ACFFD4_35355, partial [Candidatus Odinarchaeota archaeon]
MIKHSWQTFSLKNTIEYLKPDNFEIQVPLKGARDVTAEEPELAEEFMPDIMLRGLELQAERKSHLWGGFYFRVLADDSNQQRCIQYLYIWVYQKWYFSFWFSVLPALFLAICAQVIDVYLTNRMTSILLIGLSFVVPGLFSTVKRAAHRDTEKQIAFIYMSNSAWYLIFGFLFILLGLLVPTFYETTLTIPLGDGFTLSVTAVLFTALSLECLVIILLNPKLPFKSHQIEFRKLPSYLLNYFLGGQEA